MDHSQRRLDPWIAVPLATIAIGAALDIALGPEVALIAILIVGPLLASLRLAPRPTAAVAGIAFAASLLLGFENEFFGESRHVTRVIPVALAGAIAVWLARLRVQRERAALFLVVQGSVSRILSESETLAVATPRLLRVIGEALRWQLGAVWEVDADSDRIRRIESWRAHGFDAPEFEAASRDASYERGYGLPGRVWEAGEPVSIPDYRAGANYPRSDVAGESGLEAAFAFPVRSGETVVGVIEFFATGFKEVDPAQLEMFSALGRQIGQFIDRRRSQEQRAELLESERAARLAAQRAERRAGETVALLDTLLAGAPVGFAFVDTELRFVRVNDALGALVGRSADAMVGQRLSDAVPELPQMSHTVSRVIADGEPVTDMERSGETAAAPGVERHWIEGHYPVRGVSGEITGVGVVAVEITDRKRAEARANFLAEATAALNASLDYEITLTNIARLTVPYMADWCVVDILEPGAHRIRRLAIAHSDPSKERLLWEVDRRYPVDVDHGAGAAAAIRTGEPQLHKRVDDSLLREAAQDAEHLRIIRDLGLASVMVVPLVARGQPIGAVTFASAESGRIFDDEELSLAVELATRAGTAIENARLYTERSHIARTLQESLLPPRLPDMPGVELAARYRAAGEANDVGGDFYDVFPTGEQTWGVVVGDVLGKGAGAAAMIGLARHTLRAAAMRELDSVRILSTLNQALYREGAQESFCTAVYLAIDVTDGLVDIELTSAGHPLPLMLRRHGELESVGRPGTLLGAVPRLALKPHRVSLAPGDALVVFTDGVVEARSEQGVFGEHRLRRLLGTLLRTTAKDMAEHVARHAIDFQAGTPRDDLAVLVVRRRVNDARSPDPDDLAQLQAIQTDA